MNAKNIMSIAGYWVTFYIIHIDIVELVGKDTKYYWIMILKLVILSLMAFLRGFNNKTLQI